MAAQRDIARTEGIFAEISSCTALAAARKAVSGGKVSSDEKHCGNILIFYNLYIFVIHGSTCVIYDAIVINLLPTAPTRF